MALLVGIILIIFGLGWLGILGGTFIFGEGYAVADLAWYELAFWLVPGGVTLLWGIIKVLRGLGKRRKNKELMAELMAKGIPAKAKVTFVDKDYSILINNAPIYSIVEYEFTDNMGRLQTTRKEKVDSEMVIRNKIEVGSEVEIKYMPGDPALNGLLLADPRMKQ